MSSLPCHLSAPASTYTVRVSRKSSSSYVLIAIVTDAVLVALFTVVGYFTHERNFDIRGILDAAWPFLVALVAAWVLTAMWEAPVAPFRTGVGVWAVTVLGGMIVRIIIGDGTAGSFILVASGINFFTLVGWRLLARALGLKR